METIERIRAHLVAEPSFTIPFAAWELGVSGFVISECVERLLAQRAIEQIEAHTGPYAAVYAAVPVDRRSVTLHVVTGGTSERELDGREVAYVTAEAG
jgi:hypothetical protein